jgi:peptide/nickel transport system ATP-binding protein
MSEPLVTVRNLSRTFDVSKPWLNRVLEREERRLLRAVQDVSFTIGRRETFALVGESGSGKSTVANMVVGLLPPSAGSVVIEGVDMAKTDDPVRRKALRSKIQMIFQSPYASLNPRWRVDRIVAEPIRAFGLMSESRAIDAEVGRLLKTVGLDPADGAKYPPIIYLTKQL